MIPFFRKIRKQLADDNQFLKYSRYAVGEIVLVVIGILIALQINNWNEDKKTRKKELVYLENIKTDLLLNIDELNRFIEARKSCVASCQATLRYYSSDVELDIDDFNRHSINIMIWFPFTQHDNTYQELLNSGNLAIIKEKRIKNGLQNMQVGFSNIAFIEGEMQQDYESYLYESYFTTVDLETNLSHFEAAPPPSGSETLSPISRTEIDRLLQDKRFKNGISLSKYNSDLLISEYGSMIKTIQELIGLIDNELGIDTTTN